MQAFIHIGTEKTGTTTIQATLQANREALAARGVAYLKSPGMRSHRLLAACCMREDRSDDFFRDNGLTNPQDRQAFLGRFRKHLLTELAYQSVHARAVVVSSEHFHSRLREADELERLRQLLASVCERITVIVYLRPQVDTALSNYSTALKCGHAPELEDFVLQRCVPETLYYNYYALLQLWARVFGPANIRPRIFDSRDFLRGDLVEDFLAQIEPGLSAALTIRVPPQNRSLDHFGQCLLRAVNRHVPQYVEGHGLNERNLALVRLISERAVLPGQRACAPGLDREQRLAVQARFAAGNEMVRRDYFPDRPWLFSPGSETGPERPAPPVLNRSQEELLNDIVEMLAAGASAQAMPAARTAVG